MFRSKPRTFTAHAALSCRERVSHSKIGSFRNEGKLDLRSDLNKKVSEARIVVSRQEEVWALGSFDECKIAHRDLEGFGVLDELPQYGSLPLKCPLWPTSR